MAIRIAVLKESAPHEQRVAATPETVKKYCAKGWSVVVVAGAGLAAAYPDQDYMAAGAIMVDEADKATKWQS